MLLGLTNNVDWATLKGIPLPTEKYNYKVSFNGGNLTLTLYRCGNLVIINGSFVLPRSGSDDAHNPNIVAIPSGYRPTESTYIPVIGATPRNQNAAIDIDKYGKIRWSNNPAFDGNTRFFANGVYITEDEWPN